MGHEALIWLRHLKWYWLTIALVVIAAIFDPTHPYHISVLMVPPDALDPAVKGGFDEPHVLIVFFLQMCFTAVFGSAILGRFWSTRRTGAVTKIFGSFWAGYLGVVAFFRLFSLFVPALPAAVATLIVGLLLSVWQIRKTDAWQFPKSSQFGSEVWAFIAVWAVAFATFVFQVRWGDFQWVGHGAMQYQWFTEVLLKSPGFQTIPIINQHCDEILFTAFMLAPLKFGFHPIAATCVAMALVKVSLPIFIFQAFRKFGATRFLSLAAAAFLCFGSFGLDPLRYHMYFDSSSPLYFVAHITRVIGMPVWLLVISVMLEVIRKQPISATWLTTVVLGFGLAATSISNTVYVFCLFVMALLFIPIAKGRGFDRHAASILTPISIAIMFLGACFLYYPAFLWPTPIIPPGSMSGFTLLGGLVLLFAWVVKPLAGAKFEADDRRRLLRFFFAYAGSALVCLVFFANIAVTNPLNREWLQLLSSWTGYQSQAVINPFPGWQGGRPEFGGLFMVDAREQGDWVVYSTSWIYFIYLYASVPLVTIAAWWRLRRRPIELAAEEKTLFLVLLASVFILFQLFFYIDFVNDMHRSWVKTRFLEGPMYTIFVCFFAFLAWETDSRVRKFFCGLALVWSVLPVLFTERLDQIEANWWALMRLLGH